jgi:thiol:disulfide interchange protein DsbA
LSTSKPNKRLMTIRNGVIAFVVLIIVIVGGYGLFRSTAIDVSGEFVEGTHYKVIDGAPPVPMNGPIRVTEFFSYGCVHCRNFDSIVSDWSNNLPKDVSFDRSPVSFSPTFVLFGETYYTLLSTNALEQNHERIFKAIHDNGKQFLSAAMVADFVNDHGITRDAFLAALDSPATTRSMAEATKRERASRINGVPAVTVADHYMINMDSVPRKKAFEVVDFLIAKIRAERAAKRAGTTAS